MRRNRTRALSREPTRSVALAPAFEVSTRLMVRKAQGGGRTRGASDRPDGRDGAQQVVRISGCH
jgi:hypothetical protein